MDLHGTSRSRKAVLSAVVASIALFGIALSSVLWARQMAAVHAAVEGGAETASQPNSHPGATPVLVELFTSEGCSSCPPADALLARLLQQQPVPNADIIVLEEHVDYWESLGWHDRFSAHQFTDRQTGYAHALNVDSDYTPQMVVDGTAQFVGNDSSKALRAITAAARQPKPSLNFSPLTLDTGRINTSVSAAAPATLPKADLYAALIETMASTEVKRGENGGRTLHHVSVVRAMQKIGSSSDLAKPLFFSFALPKDALPQNLRVVAFAQRPDQGSVLAAATSAPPPPAY